MEVSYEIGTTPTTNISVDQIEYLEILKNKIELMEKSHQIEILKILSKNKCKLNENKSGVYVNLSFLSENTIEEIKNFMDYILDQEEMIKTVESQKIQYENSFFAEKENKDNSLLLYNQNS